MESTGVDHPADLAPGTEKFTCPNFGSRRWEGSLKRMGWLEGACPGVARLRNRKLGVTFPLAWKRGNPTSAPRRSPRLAAAKFSNARAASTLAHSKTSPGSSWRQTRPRVPSSFTGESSDSPFFQALNSLMKEKAVQESEGVEVARLATFSHASRSVDLAVQIGLHPSQVMVHRVASGAGALGEDDSLFEVRVEGELERDSARKHLTGVRAWCCR